jgi:hypothetical protein
MPANGSMNARNATPSSNRFQVTVACTAHMARTLARQSKKAASKVGVAPDFALSDCKGIG